MLLASEPAPAKQRALEALQERLRPLPVAAEQFGPLLSCFLASNRYNLSESEAAVHKHMAWRDNTFPIRASEFAADPFFKRCGVYQFGRDKQNRPLLVLQGRAFCAGFFVYTSIVLSLFVLSLLFFSFPASFLLCELNLLSCCVEANMRHDPAAHRSGV